MEARYPRIQAVLCSGSQGDGWECDCGRKRCFGSRTIGWIVLVAPHDALPKKFDSKEGAECACAHVAAGRYPFQTGTLKLRDDPEQPSACDPLNDPSADLSGRGER